MNYKNLGLEWRTFNKDKYDKTPCPENASTPAQRAYFEILTYGTPTFMGHHGYDMICFSKTENDFLNLGRVVFSTLEDNPNLLIIDELESMYQGNGFGRRMLELICDIADKNNVALQLDAARREDSKMSQQELVLWYEKFGFIRIESYTNIYRLVRNPKAIS